jgi:hypothetical protein
MNSMAVDYLAASALCRQALGASACNGTRASASELRFPAIGRQGDFLGRV